MTGKAGKVLSKGKQRTKIEGSTPARKKVGGGRKAEKTPENQGKIDNYFQKKIRLSQCPMGSFKTQRTGLRTNTNQGTQVKNLK